NRRRKLLFAGAAWALFTYGQAKTASGGKPPTVGILSTVDPAKRRMFENMLLDPLRDLGWVEGRNIVYDRAHADGNPTRLPPAGAALGSRNPSVIHVSDNFEALAAFGKTGTIPIVFAAVADPVEIGLVKSL